MREAIDQLRDAPDDVYVRVRDEIAQSINEYPNINPALRIDFFASDSLRQATLGTTAVGNVKGKARADTPSTSPPASTLTSVEEERSQDGSPRLL